MGALCEGVPSDGRTGEQERRRKGWGLEPALQPLIRSRVNERVPTAWPSKCNPAATYFGASQAMQGFATLAEMRANQEVEEDLASGLKVWSKELNMAVDLCDLQRIGYWDRMMTF